VAAAALACISTAVIWGARRFRYLGVGWLWFLGTLVPVVGIIQAGAQSMADRYAYIPLIGIFIMVVWGVADLAEYYKPARDYAIVTAVCAVFALIIVTRIQLSYWSDSISLWDHAQQVTADNYVAYNNLGEALMSRGMIEEAAPWLNKSAELEPNHAGVQVNLGMVLLSRGQTDGAIVYFKRAIELDPRSYDAYNKAGAALLRKGLLNESVPYFTTALSLSPGFAPALANLGVVFDAQGKLEDSSAYFENAIHFALDPGMGAELRYMYGTILVRRGELTKAAGQFREALKLKPDYPPATQSLSKIQGGSG
jgi:tetratricopeptide (TPR) repeat protein